MDAEGIRGGFIVTELFAAGITTIDIIIVYAFLNVKKGKFRLAVWTAFLIWRSRFLGFVIGEMSASLFMEWSGLLSGVMLGLIGLHMLLHDDSDAQTKLVSPYLIAVAVSIDAFSVSVSFGMLHLDKVLFIAATGLFSLVFSYAVLRFKGRLGIKDGRS